MHIRDVIDFVNGASGPSVFIFCLLSVILTHMRGVWVWGGDCRKAIAERDETIRQLRAEAAADKRRLEEEKDELLNLAINGTSQAAALGRVVAALKGGNPP